MSDFTDKTDTYQRVVAQVDLDAILHNIYHMRQNIAPDTKLMAVIKTDGYGHGSVPIAHCLEPLEEIYGFAVATAEEAHILRESGVSKPILVLGYTFPYAYELMAREQIRAAVFRRDSIAGLAKAAAAQDCRMKVHIKVDTGMGRIGITPDWEGLAFVEQLMKEPNIEIEGIFTHFARADERDKNSALEQLGRFREFIYTIESSLGLRIPIRHCSNSAGILELPEANMDLVRAGITLYGLSPSDEVSGDSVPLEPALSLYSRIVYMKTICSGQSVSYGGTFTASKDTRVATIPVGYGDGYPRSLSGRGYVLLHGQRAPILGRVCMDQFMIDVTDIPQAREGDRVTLIGKDGEEHISAEHLGELSGRFNYELVCDLGKRIPRVYMREGRVVAVKDYHNDYSME